MFVTERSTPKSCRMQETWSKMQRSQCGMAKHPKMMLPCPSTPPQTPAMVSLLMAVL